MLDELNFGFQKNGKVCLCGRHHGTGPYSPQDRAAIAARMRDKMPDLMAETMREYLKSWEGVHGRVSYLMTTVGVNEGTFVKASKGQTINGPVFQENRA